MKRAAQLLLLLLSVWLLSSTAGRVPRAPYVGPPLVSSEERVRPGVEHVAAECATPQVAKAPLLSRVPLASGLPARDGSVEHDLVPQLRDRRAALRRVRARRRLPRLEAGEPPWS